MKILKSQLRKLVEETINEATDKYSKDKVENLAAKFDKLNLQAEDLENELRKLIQGKRGGTDVHELSKRITQDIEKVTRWLARTARENSV